MERLITSVRRWLAPRKTVAQETPPVAVVPLDPRTHPRIRISISGWTRAFDKLGGITTQYRSTRSERLNVGGRSQPGGERGPFIVRIVSPGQRDRWFIEYHDEAQRDRLSESLALRLW